MSKRHAPEVSYYAVRDVLTAWHVLHEPSCLPAGKTFCAVGMLLDDVIPSLVLDIPLERTLFITKSSLAQFYLERYRESFFIILHGERELPDWLDRSNRNRVLIIEAPHPEAYSRLALSLQDFFMRVSFWTCQMDGVIRRKDTFQTLVDVSEDILEFFIAVVDNSFTLVACTQKPCPRNEFVEDLVKTRCCPLSLLDLVGGKSLSGDGIWAEKHFASSGQEGNDTTLIFLPISSHGQCMGHVIACVEATEISKGKRSLLGKFKEYAGMLCDALWGSNVKTPGSSRSFFSRLIFGEPLRRSYVEVQKTILGIPPRARMYVFIVDNENASGDSKTAPLFQAIQAEGRTTCHPFFHETHLAGLCCCEPDDQTLTDIEVAAELERRVCHPFGRVIGLSYSFTDIFDIGLAFRQAWFSLYYRVAIDGELSAFVPECGKPVYSFKEAFPFYSLQVLLDKGNELAKYTADKSFLHVLREHDEKNGTDDFKLLWMYLRSGGDSSFVAHHMFIHRNTVTNHIEALEKRYGLNLSDPYTIDQIVFEYRMIYLISKKKYARSVRAIEERLIKPREGELDPKIVMEAGNVVGEVPRDNG